MQITKEQLELITSTVIQIHEKEREEAEKKKKDKRLRNTKILLQNYRAFKKYAENVVGDENVDDTEIDFEDFRVNGEDLVQSIRQTTQRTLIMVKHIDHAFEALKHLYSIEKHPGTKRQYNILCDRYVDGLKIDEITEKYEIDVRNVYRALNTATERLSIILFGVYGIKIE